MKVKDFKISDLIPYEDNPRHNESAVDAVAASIEEFGFKVPIVIDKDKIVVAGHTRLKAAEKLGLDKVPCIVADDLTEEQIRAFRLADNKVSELASWDFDKLELELQSIEDIDMSQFGFDDSEFLEDGEVEDDNWDPVLPDEPVSKPGEIYQLGRHRLMVGDSTKVDDVKKLMDGNLADLLLTDPPYNVALGYDMTPEEAKRIKRRTDGLTIDNDKFEDDTDFINFLAVTLANGADNLKPGGVYYIWLASTQSLNYLSGARAAGLSIREILIWVKSIFAFSRQDYHWRHELCLYGWKDGAAHYFVNDRTQDTVWDDTPDFDKLTKDEAIRQLKDLYEYTTVLYADKPNLNKIHPTMKPVELFGQQIKNSTRKGEAVLDLFGGSGTTIIAAEQLDRTAYVMEFDPKYADAIINRYEDFTGDLAIKING